MNRAAACGRAVHRTAVCRSAPRHSRRVSGLDHVDYVCAAPGCHSRASARLPLKVVGGSWREEFVVLDKPSGLSVIPCDKAGDSVVQRLKGLGLTSDDIKIVHRLDKMTHGLVCVGLSRVTGAELARSLRAKSWRKLYRVLCTVPPPQARASFVPLAPIEGALFEPGTGRLLPSGLMESHLRARTDASRVKHPFLFNSMLWESVAKPPKPVFPEDLVDRPRSPREERKRRIRAGFGPGVALGRVARTAFTLVGSGRDAAGRDVALYIARLLTGRTHQLRVHFSDAGAPLLGDYYYNSLFYDGRQYPGQEAAVDMLATSPFCLQAFGVQFPHPGRTGDVVQVVLPPPDSWRGALQPESAAALFSQMHAFDMLTSEA